MFTGITHDRLSDSAPDGPLVCSNVLISSNTAAKNYVCLSLSTVFLRQASYTLLELGV